MNLYSQILEKAKIYTQIQFLDSFGKGICSQIELF